MSFEEYLRSDNDISLEVDNWQTRVLTSEIDPSQTPSLSLAKKRLREMAMVGLTEELDVTLKLVSRVFGWPEVSGLGRLNSTIQPSEYSDLTDSAREFAARKNSLDVELYNYGKELFGELVRVHVLE
ncbi:hypothetical protein [Pelagicoccus sp. SDUM812005]|uniref:hypothetical protein n=1 Tax=Pelagicoccus sp. SDUM812005 TaxID=3041257 RepID=UPI0031BBBF03